ncbi:hypothetical protein ANCDUO_14937 [Ancylostoma duodenale]|uniref:Uncharacterized protein n=1 Tax=Ancylostoma duodenale TaxID=51022 RepID=A0A0C2CF12_9BILA|nr:hypothetical protein ANCDUO_14937 [Ancylostoma duodenale]
MRRRQEEPTAFCPSEDFADDVNDVPMSSRIATWYKSYFPPSVNVLTLVSRDGPDFLEAFANTVMEHEKLQITDATMLLKEHESSVFNIGSPRIVHKTAQQSDVKLNGLPTKEPVTDVFEGSSDLQRPLHVQVNGFGKVR